MPSLRFKLFLPSYDEDGNELPALEVEDPYKNDYQQVRERGLVQVL